MTNSSRVIPDHKTFFEPISDDDTAILILGTIPGDRSLEVGEYYGHPQNRFWRAIAAVTGHTTPADYSEKTAMLRRSGIGLWDVARTAVRQGSLDSAIRDEEPNDIAGLLAAHPKIKTVAFNGRTAEKLYDKYFDRHPGIEYLSLPSTSPANAAFSFDAICERWMSIFT